MLGGNAGKSARSLVNRIPVEWVEWYSTGLICVPTRMTMSVGYNPWVKSVYFSTQENLSKEGSHLTATKGKAAFMTVNPGTGSTGNAEIK